MRTTYAAVIAIVLVALALAGNAQRTPCVDGACANPRQTCMDNECHCLASFNECDGGATCFSNEERDDGICNCDDKTDEVGPCEVADNEVDDDVDNEVPVLDADGEEIGYEAATCGDVFVDDVRVEATECGENAFCLFDRNGPPICACEIANGVFCRDGVQCVPASAFNDGYADCNDGSDEPFQGFEAAQCGNGDGDDFPGCGLDAECDFNGDPPVCSCFNDGDLFCADGRQCIPADSFNDGYADCEDGSDEQAVIGRSCQFIDQDGVNFLANGDGCGLGATCDTTGNPRCVCDSPSDIFCSDGRQCISPSQVGDDNIDCADGSDEGDGNGDPSDSGGDPHISTFDGVYYDYQGVGLHWYAKDTGAGNAAIEVQTCQRPWVSNPTSATVNSAVTVKTADGLFTLAYDTDSSSFKAYVGDTETPSSSFPMLLGNTIITSTSTGSSWSVVSSAGTVRLQTSTWAQWININFAPNTQTSVAGLAGTNDGVRINDFTLPDGSFLSLSNGGSWTHAAAFGAAWAVADGDSFMPAALECSSDAPGFEAFDLVQWFADNGNQIILTGADQKTTRRASQLSADSSLTLGEFDAALDCIDEIGMVASGSARDVVNRIFDTDATDAEISEAVAVIQAAYDLLLLGEDSTCAENSRILVESSFFVAASNTLPADCCSNVGVCNLDGSCECPMNFEGDNCETAIPIDDIPDPVEGEEYIAMCTADSRCAAASVTSTTNSASIKWASDGGCPDNNGGGGDF